MRGLAFCWVVLLLLCLFVVSCGPGVMFLFAKLRKNFACKVTKKKGNRKIIKYLTFRLNIFLAKFCTKKFFVGNNAKMSNFATR